MNKVIVFNPSNIKKNGSIPAYFNKELSNAYTKDNLSYITFIFEDLSKNLIDQNKFISDYKEFMKKWDLPYCFFPYYVYFNKLLPELMNKPNPKFNINIKDDLPINVICSPAYGFLMLDIKKLKSINFKFNEEYTELYYLQDLIQKCFENKFWISNCCFIDRFESWKDLKEQIITGLLMNNEKFNEEKTKYDKQGFTYQSLQEFLQLLKGKYIK